MDNPLPVKCFAVVPFSDDYKVVWDTIESCVDSLNDNNTLNIKVVRALDAPVKNELLPDHVTEQISECDIAIVDLTEERHNVIFEFGYAYAKGRKIIPMAQTDKLDVSKLASDYISFVYIPYKVSNLDFLKAQLRTRIKDYVEEIRSENEHKELENKVLIDKNELQVSCIKDREIANLNVVFEGAKEQINILTTNLASFANDYSESIGTALGKIKGLRVRFLTLDPESSFAEKRALQLGRDVSEFRTELHRGLYQTYEKFCHNKDNTKVEIRTYDDFPTQITFQVDKIIYNCVVSKYQASRNNCLFKLDANYPAIYLSFHLHFTSVWRDTVTTKKYNPDSYRAFPINKPPAD